jgi:hypothetical protein
MPDSGQVARTFSAYRPHREDQSAVERLFPLVFRGAARRCPTDSFSAVPAPVDTLSSTTAAGSTRPSSSWTHGPPHQILTKTRSTSSLSPLGVMRPRFLVDLTPDRPGGRLSEGAGRPSRLDLERVPGPGSPRGIGLPGSGAVRYLGPARTRSTARTVELRFFGGLSVEEDRHCARTGSTNCETRLAEGFARSCTTPVRAETAP